VVEAFQPAARKGSIDLAVHAGDIPDTVLGDAARLEQVVMSLVSNALKFTPAGGSIRVEVGGDETAVMVAVRDSGPGVPPAQRLQLFSERKAGMPGIGLAICRRVLEAHGGRIWLEDTAEGAAVMFRLPAS
jgi:signal transduction histidine kinase